MTVAVAGDSLRGRLRVRICCALLALALIAGAGADHAPAQQPGPRIAAKAWILIDARDGTVLASKGPNRRLPIASATKLMTAYLTLQKLKPNQLVAAAPYRPSASTEILLGLRPGEQLKARDLLYGLLLPSANDAAHTLAVKVGGTEQAFVTQMNQAAQQLGLADTSYANPIGLDDPANYSSAQDLTTLTDRLLENRLFARIVDTPAASLSSGDRPRRVTSRNGLVLSQPFIGGVKTGHTIGAGYVLVASGTRDATTLISAVLGAGSEAARDAETLKLMNFGFSQYQSTEPVKQGEELADPELDYRSDTLPLVAKEAITVKSRQGQPVETVVDAPDEVSGAVEQGEELGSVTVTVEGQEAASTPLIASRSVEAASLLNKAVGTAQNPILLLPLGAIVIVVGVLLASRGRRPSESEFPPAASRRERREPRERTPDERRRMHEERMQRRRDRMQRRGQ